MIVLENSWLRLKKQVNSRVGKTELTSLLSDAYSFSVAVAALFASGHRATCAVGLTKLPPPVAQGQGAPLARNLGGQLWCPVPAFPK